MLLLLIFLILSVYIYLLETACNWLCFFLIQILKSLSFNWQIYSNDFYYDYVYKLNFLL